MNGWRGFVKDVGFPIAVSLILLGMITGLIPSSITRAETMLRDHVAMTQGIRPLLRQICLNTAPDNSTRRRCVSEGE